MFFPKKLFRRYKKLKRNTKRKINGVLNQTLVFDEDILKIDALPHIMDRIIKIVVMRGENLEKRWDYGVPSKMYKKILKMNEEEVPHLEISKHFGISLEIVQKIISHI